MLITSGSAALVLPVYRQWNPKNFKQFLSILWFIWKDSDLILYVQYIAVYYDFFFVYSTNTICIYTYILLVQFVDNILNELFVIYATWCIISLFIMKSCSTQITRRRRKLTTAVVFPNTLDMCQLINGQEGQQLYILHSVLIHTGIKFIFQYTVYIFLLM